MASRLRKSKAFLKSVWMRKMGERLCEAERKGSRIERR